MLPVMDVSVISLDEDPSLFGGVGARDASSERERRVRVKDGLKKVPEFNSKCTMLLFCLALPDKISAHL